MNNQIQISLAVAPTGQHQLYKEMSVPVGTTIWQALQLAGWLDEGSELAELADFKQWCEQVKDKPSPTAKNWYVGIYSHKQSLDYVLKDNDRIEIYRDLTADPMNRRKTKAKDKGKR